MLKVDKDDRLEGLKRGVIWIRRCMYCVLL